jgi:uncharacterized ferredoxin-like protein
MRRRQPRLQSSRTAFQFLRRLGSLPDPSAEQRALAAVDAGVRNRIVSGGDAEPENIGQDGDDVAMENGIDSMRAEIIRTVGRLCAAAAVTAPKSGGQLFLKGKPLFIETVLVDDPATLKRLAHWMRARGREWRQDLWFRDAAMAERMDGVLFVGLKDWYPPIYDCGACGYATCAEFMAATKQLRVASEAFEFAGPHCNLRDIDLGIAVGSAAKTASLNNVDTRCQTRIAVAARKLGLIEADISIALSMSITHKNVAFDNRMAAVDFDAPEVAGLPGTGTLPVKQADRRWSHLPHVEAEE